MRWNISKGKAPQWIQIGPECSASRFILGFWRAKTELALTIRQRKQRSRLGQAPTSRLGLDSASRAGLWGVQRVGQAQRERGRPEAWRGPHTTLPPAPPGRHHLNAAPHRRQSARRQIASEAEGCAERAPNPSPACGRPRRGSLCGGVPTPAGRAVGTRASGQSRPLPAACKELCHAGRRAALRQVSPSVTQLFRVSFLGSRHITRLMSTPRFVINPPARSTATDGRWSPERSALPSGSQLSRKTNTPWTDRIDERPALFPGERLTSSSALWKPRADPSSWKS